MLSTILGAAISVASVLGLRDHVRLVELLGLFFGGFGSGAAVTLLVATRGGRRAAP